MLLLNNIKAFKLTKKEKNLFVEVESYLKDEIVDTFMRDAELTYQNSKKFDEMFKDFPKRHHPYFDHIKNEVLGWQNKAQEYIDSAKEKKLLADKNELYEKKIGRQKKYFISSVVGVVVVAAGCFLLICSIKYGLLEKHGTHRAVFRLQELAQCYSTLRVAR
jgi:hypothetical protein